METIAIIGLGVMGAPMAVNPVKAGYDVVGYARTPEKARALETAGGRTAGSTAEAVAQSRLVLMGAVRAQGHGSLDHSALLLLVEQLSGRTSPTLEKEV